MWTEAWTRRLPVSPGTLELYLIWGVLCTRHGILAADVAGRVTLFSPTGEPTVLGSHDGPVRRLARDEVHPGDVHATSGDDLTVRLWDPANRTALGVLRGHDAAIHSLAVGVHKGRTLVLSGSADLTVIVWDAATARPLHILRGHTGPVYQARFHTTADATVAVTGGEDGTVRVWNLDDGTCSTVLHGHTSAVWSVTAEGPLLLSGADDGELIGWDVARSLPRYRVRAHEGWIHDIAVDRTGPTPLAATTGDRTVGVWDAETGRAVLRLDGHTGPTTKVRFARRDGRPVLVTSAEDRRVRAWNLTDGSEVDGVATVADGSLFDVSPGGSLAVAHGPHVTVHTYDRITDTEQEARAT